MVLLEFVHGLSVYAPGALGMLIGGWCPFGEFLGLSEQSYVLL